MAVYGGKLVPEPMHSFRFRHGPHDLRSTRRRGHPHPAPRGRRHPRAEVPQGRCPARQRRARRVDHTAFPRGHWHKIASTNPLEPINKEIKRRSNVVGIFPDDASVIRLVGAVLLDQHDDWAIAERRYLSEESMPAIDPDPEEITTHQHPRTPGRPTSTTKPRLTELLPPLPGTRPTVAVLRAWRQRQLEEQMLTGRRAGDDAFVFSKPDGGPVHPDNFSQVFARHVATSTLPRIACTICATPTPPSC